MIYSYLSSNDRETGAETGFFSPAAETFQLFPPLNVLFVIQDICLSLQILHWGRMQAPSCSSQAALPPGFDRKGQHKAGRPTRTLTKNIGALFCFSVGQHIACLGAGRTRLRFRNFLEALLIINHIGIKIL